MAKGLLFFPANLVKAIIIMFKVFGSTCAPHLQTHLPISKLALQWNQQVCIWLIFGHYKVLIEMQSTAITHLKMSSVKGYTGMLRKMK